MAQNRFKVKIQAKDAFYKILREMDQEPVYQRIDSIEGGFTVSLIVYEKYYFRNSSRASLTVFINDYKGYTEVEVVPSGGSQGLFLNIDWGAGNSFAGAVHRILDEDMA